MMVKVIKESIEQFFARGRKIARLADEGKAIPDSHIISSDISTVDEQSSTNHLPEIKIAINEIRPLALETFGSEAKADKWLNSIHPILGMSPISAMETSTGTSEVKKILNAIMYGGVV